MADLLAHRPAADRAALAVLAIFSVMWRWNDFLWPLVVLSKTEIYTLQVGLNAFQGELNAVALPARDDRRDLDPGRPRLRVPAALHHHRHRQYRDEITDWVNHG